MRHALWWMCSCLLFLMLESCVCLHPIYKQLSKKAMPSQDYPNPLAVHVGFYVESLGNFRSTEMTFDMDLYLYMSWRDPSLAHNESDYVLINDKSILDKIWLPDLYFANARTAYFHEVTVHNFNMFVSPDGTIAYGTRVTLNVACTLNLQDYPLDSQTCYIKIISYAHVKKEMNATWFNDGPIRYNPEIGLPEYHILSLDSGYCNGVFHYTITHNSSRIGDFSCMQGMIKLQRAIGYHLVQSYIPTGLIVAISWVSFWIDRRAVPARVSLSFTTLLTLSTQGNGIRYALPPVSYAKAIDYFYGVCMLFIFGVLLEFALVNSYMRRANKYNHMAERLIQGGQHNAVFVATYRKYYERSTMSTKPLPCHMDVRFAAAADSESEPTKEEEAKMHDTFQGSGMDDYDSDGSVPPQKFYGRLNKSCAHLMYKSIRFSRKALFIDQVSRFVFPAVFTIFNIVYWMYYLNEKPKAYKAQESFQ